MSFVDKMRWRIDRLRAMGLEEILYRVRIEGVKRAWRAKGFPMPPNAPSDAQIAASSNADFFALNNLDFATMRQAPETRNECEALILEAEGYLKHQWRYFGFFEHPAPKKESSDWQTCDKTGLSADANAFGPEIDYRISETVGNVKYTWEKSRHHHTQVLALAYRLTGDERFAVAAFKELEDWINKNPAAKGINWTSALEHGVRLTAWVWIYHLLIPHPRWPEFFASNSPFWVSVYQHQVFTSSYESKGSSANNHLLGEVTGQYLAALVWPFWPESRKWREEAKHILEREISMQVFASGLNREMGFGYHVFSLELFILPAIVGAQRQDAFSANYLNAVRDQIRALAWLMDAKGNLPTYGDADEAFAAQLQSRDTNRVNYLLRLGRRWLGVACNEPANNSGTLACDQLIGYVPNPNLPSENAPNTFAFSDAGQYSLGYKRGTPEEILVLADAGPHGYLSIAGHGHADALSFTLNVGGQPVLVDPGTFVYHTDLTWRRIFKSTRFHNTVELDNEDQSVQAGAFMWSRKANTVAHAFEAFADGGRLLASHDGYERMNGKPHHTREIVLRAKQLSITDEISGSGQHSLRLMFHLHPECEATETAKSVWALRWPGGQATLRFDERLRVRAAKGENNPEANQYLGWYSPRFDVKVPSISLEASFDAINLPIKFNTFLEIA